MHNYHDGMPRCAGEGGVMTEKPEFVRRTCTILVATDAYAGLCIYASNPWVNKDEMTCGFSWTITHVNTGHAIHSGIQSKEDAERELIELSKLTDWERLNSVELITADLMLKEKVRAVVHKFKIEQRGM